MTKASHKRIILAGAVLLLAVLIGVFYFIYSSVAASLLEEDIGALLEEVAVQSRDTLTANIERDLSSLESMAAALGHMEGAPGDPEILGFLRTEADRNDMVLFYSVVSAGGSAISTEGHTGDVRQDEAYIVSMAGESFVSAPLEASLGEKRRVIRLSVPIWRNGAVIGVLAAAYSAESYQQALLVKSFRGEGYSYVLKQSGEAILVPGEDELPDNGLMGPPYNDLLALPELKPMFDDMLAGNSGWLQYSPPGQGRQFLSYTPMGIRDWYFVSIVPAGVVAQKTRLLSVVSAFSAMTVLVTLAALGLYFYASRRKRQRELIQAAHYDRLTGLYSEKKFQESYNELPRRTSKACVLIEVGRMGQLRSVFSPEAGDRMLVAIASLIRDFLEPESMACRLTDDRFFLLVRGDNPQGLIKDLKGLVEKLDSLGVVENGSAYNFHCTFTCGVYLLTEEDRDVSRVINLMILGSPMLGGREESSCTLYTEAMLERMKLRAYLAPQAGEAILKREIVPYYQPQYDMSTNRVVGAELLARWNHPDKGLLYPSDFMPVLEDEGLSLELDLYMLEEACKKIQGWTDAQLLPVPISVNISRLNLYKDDFVDRAIAIAEKYGIPPVLIELEMGEEAVLENSGQRLTAIIKRLQEFGFLLSLDDFGSGRSSLMALRLAPIDTLKIGRAFFGNGTLGQRERLLLIGVVKIAKALGIKVVSQGVELAEQAELLKSVGCTAAQGFLYSEALSNEQFEQLIF